MPKHHTISRLPSQAHALFVGIGREYAEADDDAWEELRDHLDGRIALIAGADPNRHAALVAEFERVRDRTVAARGARRLVAALSGGAATLARSRGDGLEEWRVTAETGETAMLLVPSDESLPHDALRTARTALLTGTCPSCGRTAELIGGTLEVQHNSLCKARKAL